jgi:hypothetical protein
MTDIGYKEITTRQVEKLTLTCIITGDSGYAYLERERERERERETVCVCARVRVHVCVCARVWGVIMPCFRWLVASLSLSLIWWTEFDLSPVHTEFLVDKVEVGQVPLQFL